MEISELEFEEHPDHNGRFLVVKGTGDPHSRSMNGRIDMAIKVSLEPSSGYYAIILDNQIMPLIKHAPILYAKLRGCRDVLRECAKQMRAEGGDRAHSRMADKFADMASVAIAEMIEEGLS